MTLRTSPLDAAHRALGAKMVPFGGWDMPLSYGDGTIAEHKACRTGGVVFDVSHLGTVRVEGSGSLTRLQAALTNDLQEERAELKAERAELAAQHAADQAELDRLRALIIQLGGQP